MSAYQCSVCDYVYHEYSDNGEENVAFEKLPEDWRCPRCGSSKRSFCVLQKHEQNSSSVGKSSNR